MALGRSQLDEAQRSANDANQSQRLANLIELEPGITSYNTDWRSITLETFDLLPGETPEYCLDHYVVNIALGPNKGGKFRQIIGHQCQETTFSSGSVSICPVHRPHYLELKTPAQVLSLNLKPELLHLHAAELLGRDRVELLPELNIRDDLIFQFGLALQAELQTSARADRIYAETLTNGLAVHLLKNYATFDNYPIKDKGGLSSQKLRLVTDYINDNLERELGLQELATLTQLSQCHFCHMFKRSTGLSPHKYVTRQRVERAKVLLKRGAMTLAEIALACGFSHQSHCIATLSAKRV